MLDFGGFAGWGSVSLCVHNGEPEQKFFRIVSFQRHVCFLLHVRKNLHKLCKMNKIVDENNKKLNKIDKYDKIFRKKEVEIWLSYL